MPGRELPRPRGEATVLLVEDEPQVRQVVQTLLEQAGYVVLVARDGHEALEVAKQVGKLDLLLSDVRMPLLGGVELASKLQSSWPGVKVLLMSGYADSSTSAGEPGAPCYPVLAKPFGTGELLKRVQLVLEGTDTSPVSRLP